MVRASSIIEKSVDIYPSQEKNSLNDTFKTGQKNELGTTVSDYSAVASVTKKNV